MKVKFNSSFLWVFIHVLFICLIIFICCFKYISFKRKYEIKVRKPLIKYKVLNIIKHKKLDDGTISTIFKVQINDHQYEMITTSAHNNIIFKHLENCKDCKEKYPFSFSTFDGLDSKMYDSFKKLK